MAVRPDVRTPGSVTDEYPAGIRGLVSAARSLLTGIAITAGAVLRGPVTIRYPEEKLTVSDRWRGALRLRGALGRDEVPLVRDAPPAYNGVIDGLYRMDRLPACVGNCPANVDARGQSFLVADGRAAEAYELVRERNVMPGVLGRICHHPCETACRRNYYDEPIAIRPLHRFAYEEFQRVRPPSLPRFESTSGKSVAIVGSGPSGLAAALDLMRLGHRVTMYEREAAGGGALLSGVPSYRLPRDVLAREIQDLVDMGLDLRCGIEIGKDKPLGELMRDHDAVLLAVGLQLSRILPIPGADAEGVDGALEFLRKANHGRDAGVEGKSVFVVGGGNVAVDVARCALRVGASEVRLASLESEVEMPAHPWEIEEALDEGVIAICSVGPEEVLHDGGRVTGMRVRECLSVFDAAGRFAPTFGDELTDFPCDVVVFAIGQAAKVDTLISGTEVLISGQGRLVVDGALFTTSTPGVFACGEVVTGPGSAIGSIATGHEAATSIDRYLAGLPIDLGRVARPVPIYEKYVAADLAGVEPDRRRPVMPMSSPDDRVEDFQPIELGYEPHEAIAEAARCLWCESEACVGCTFCARTCPDYALVVDRADEPGSRSLIRYDLDLSKCCFCGLCAEQCPTKALTHTGQYELSFYHRDVMLFERDEMLRDGGGDRATGRDVTRSALTGDRQVERRET